MFWVRVRIGVWGRVMVMVRGRSREVWDIPGHSLVILDIPGITNRMDAMNLGSAYNHRYAQSLLKPVEYLLQ